MSESFVAPRIPPASLATSLPEPFRQPATNPKGAGFILLSSSLSPLAYNSQAAQILTYPEKPDDPIELETLLARKVRTKLLASHLPSGNPVFMCEFKSGRRPYVCRSFDLGSPVGASSSSSVGLLLERKLAKLIALDGVAERYRLTQRERESVEYLLRGLTSKEIGAQMGISANTVKCFLRLVMIKMGVTTRSGIVGKIVDCESI